MTDSAASLPEHLAQEWGIRVVPMRLQLGRQSLRDGDISLEELVGRLAEGVTTSGPAPGELAEAICEADQGAGVVVLCVSSAMSGTFQAATVAARLTGSDVRVVDTRTAAGAQGLAALAAGRSAESGASLDDVEASALSASRATDLVATVPDLSYLARSGRVPGVAAWAGNKLGLSPMFEFSGARVRALRPARGLQGALERMIALWERTIRHDARLQVAALHSLEPAGAEWLLAEVGKRCQPELCFTAPFGPVMVAHTGPGLVGLAWLWEVDRSRPDGDLT